MTQQERELVWLTRKVKEDKDLIACLEDYMEEHSDEWSKAVHSAFQDAIFKKRDELYYAEHRFEKLAWKIHAQREEPEAGLVPRY